MRWKIAQYRKQNCLQSKFQILSSGNFVDVFHLLDVSRNVFGAEHVFDH